MIEVVTLCWARAWLGAAILACGGCEALFGVDPGGGTGDGGGGLACGNGRIDPGESCDTAIPEGQPGACPRGCDDANSCTTDVLLAAGGCAARCQHDAIPNCCGNGRLDQDEACDDGNQNDFDGCSRDCRFERALVLDSMTIPPASEGCDLNGDGAVDNRVSLAMNDPAREFTSTYLTNQELHSHKLVALWIFVGADPWMQRSWGSGFVVGQDLDASLDNNYDGHEPFGVRAENLDAQGHMARVVAGSAPGGILFARAPLMHLEIPEHDWAAVEMVMSSSTISGMLTSDGTGPTEFQGRLCGILGAVSLYHFTNQTGASGATLLDQLVLGMDLLAYHITPTQPDFDVDGDGLERFMDTDGDHVIDLCIDGNGTQITGQICPEDPRIVDGYSFAYDQTAVRALLAGRAP